MMHVRRPEREDARFKDWYDKLEQSFKTSKSLEERLMTQALSKGMEPRSKHALEAEYGRVWDQEEFEKEFWVHFYDNAKPRLLVRSKFDLERYWMRYQDGPRLYFGLRIS